MHGTNQNSSVGQAESLDPTDRIKSSLLQVTSEKELVDSLGQYVSSHDANSMLLTYFQVRQEAQVAEDVAKWTPGGVEEIKMAWMQSYRLEDSVLGSLWLKAVDAPLFVEDSETDPRLGATSRPSVIKDFGHSLAVLPLKRNGQWQGVITIGWSAKHAFSDEERSVFASLLPALSAIAFNRRTYFEAETIQRRYEVIAQTNAALGQANSENEILSAVASLVKQYGAALSSLNFTHYDEADNLSVLEIVAFHVGGKPIPTESIPGGAHRTRANTPLWHLMLGDAAFFIEDMRTDARADAVTRENAERAKVVAFIALPLKVADRWVGALSFGWSEPHIFPAELQEIISVITPTLTAVVANRRLLAQTISLYRITEERLRAVVNNAPLMLYSWDRDGRFNLAEGRGLENYNLKPGELVGQSAFEIYSENPEVVEDIKRGLAGESFATLVNLNDLVYQAWYSPVQDKAGAVTGLISVAFDVTERKLAEQALEKVNRQLRDASRFKDEFLAMMSHELRTPLNAMIGLLGITLMEGDLSEDVRMLVQRARANSDRLLNLINNILDISRMEAGRLEIVNGPVTLRGLISKLKSDVSILAEQKKLELAVDISDSVPQEVLLDQDAITKILTNLLGNAIKFTDQGSVTLNVGTSNDQLLIEVKDTGVGIPAHMQQVIFESFRQVDASSTRRHGGSGLGLAIVHNLCVAMGGSIRVDSKPSAGSTFVVTLPLRPVNVVASTVSVDK